MPAQVLIVGAGPTGLMLGLLLARQGIKPRIIEKNSGPGQASRALAVHARTLEFYRQLGLADEIVAQGIKIETVHLRESGKEVTRFSLKDMGAGLSPYPFLLCYPQDEHERFLVAQLKSEGVEVEWKTALKSFTENDTNVRAVLDKTGQEEFAEFAYLCGCDGARSTIREGLGLDFAGGTYAHRFYVADVKTERDYGTDAFMNLQPEGFGLMMPVRSSGMERLIGIVPAAMKDTEDLSFEDIQSNVESILGIRVAQTNWFSTYHVHHRVAAHFHVGRCFIAGDAGHIHSPAGGQGMNTGIGDAVNLAWKIAHVLKERAAPALLETYEAERIGFARSLVSTTDRVFQGVVAIGWAGKFIRGWIAYFLAVFTKFLSVRRFVFKTLSQTRLSYRSTTVFSEGLAGNVAGGDRLPWVADSATTQDNFAPLRTLDWQIHIYGAVTKDLTEKAGKLRLPIHPFAWNEEAHLAGLQQDAAYLVRPDGYVALALPDQDPKKLESFRQRFQLVFSDPQSTRLASETSVGSSR